MIQILKKLKKTILHHLNEAEIACPNRFYKYENSYLEGNINWHSVINNENSCTIKVIFMTLILGERVFQK